MQLYVLKPKCAKNNELGTYTIKIMYYESNSSKQRSSICTFQTNIQISKVLNLDRNH